MSWKPGIGNAVTIGNGRCSVPQSKKKTKRRTATSKKVARALRAWAKPIKDVKDLAFMRPEDADDLLSAIREMREHEHRGAIARIEHQAMQKTKRKRAPKRA
jgi:hypothetical protein